LPSFHVLTMVTRLPLSSRNWSPGLMGWFFMVLLVVCLVWRFFGFVHGRVMACLRGYCTQQQRQ
jgi:hypothetical protein